jgi:type IV secretion system protein TrbL
MLLMMAAVFLGLSIKESPMNDGILNQVINQYTGSISNIQSESAGIGLGFFNTIAAISIALLAFNHLMRKNVDMVDSNLELIKWLIYLNFFYYFIVNYNSIYGLFFDTVDQIGNLLGAKASGLPTVTDISAQTLFHTGFLVAKNIWTINVTFNLIKDLQMVLIAVLTGAVVLYCFAVIGLELILVQIGSKIILAGGIFLLAFAGLQWTRDYAERYVHTFFHIGIKMIFIYILIGLGLGLAKTWPNNVPNTSDLGTILDYDIGVALSAYVYYKLCLKLPDQAVSWLTGRLAMGFDTAADVKGAAHQVAHGAVNTGKYIKEKAIPAMKGNAKAYDTAYQATKDFYKNQLIKVGEQKIINETIKTLGRAGREVKQAESDKKIDETFGGKVSKQIKDDVAQGELTNYSI